MPYVDPIPRPRRGPQAYADLVRRITPRDRWILRMCFEHKVFTTGQLADLAWDSYFTAAHRLTDLVRLGALARWRPYARARSAPWHWTVAPLGAEILAADRGVTVVELGYRSDHANATFLSAQLFHQVGVNGVFCGLARTSRTLSTTEPENSQRDGLDEWWPQARCEGLWGAIVRPDAYGRWRQDGHIVEFFLEYDTGTETLGRVAAKIDRYAELARATGITTPALIHFPTARREANFQTARRPVPSVPVATTSDDIACHNPAGPVWAMLGDRPTARREPDRVRLIDLAQITTAHTNSSASSPRDAAEPPAPSAWTTRPTADASS